MCHVQGFMGGEDGGRLQVILTLLSPFLQSKLQKHGRHGCLPSSLLFDFFLLFTLTSVWGSAINVVFSLAAVFLHDFYRGTRTGVVKTWENAVNWKHKDSWDCWVGVAVHSFVRSSQALTIDNWIFILLFLYPVLKKVSKLSRFFFIYILHRICKEYNPAINI